MRLSGRDESRPYIGDGVSGCGARFPSLVAETVVSTTQTVFAASWGRSTWAITVVFVLVVQGLAVWLLLWAMKAWPYHRNAAIGVVALAVALTLADVCAALFAPRGYVVLPQALVIRRIGPDIRIPARDVSEVQILPGDAVFRNSIRTCASGGAFGFYGRWNSPSMGNFLAYVTRTDEIVVIRRRAQPPVVISPDDSERFVHAAQEKLGVAGRGL